MVLRSIFRGLRRSELTALRALGKLQRPLAWVALGYGTITLAGTVLELIAADEPRFTMIGVASLTFLEGLSLVMEVENELDSEGAADDD